MESAYSGDGKFIFFSYSHDNQKLLEPFFDELAKKYNVWHDRDIPYGTDWESIIKEHVAKSSLFMFVVTPESLLSDYCKKEIKWANENDISFISVVVNRINVPDDLKEKQLCNLFDFLSYDEAIKEIARRNSAINITIRDEYINDNSKQRRESGYQEALAGVLQRRRNFGNRSIGSFEDFVKAMNNDYAIIDDLEFATKTLPSEIFDRCFLQKGINSKFKYLLGVCYRLGIGVDIDIKAASKCFLDAIKENTMLPPNMLNNSIWALEQIVINCSGDESQYNDIIHLFSSLSIIFFKEYSFFDHEIKRIMLKESNYDYDRLIRDINDSKELNSIDKNILLGRLFTLTRQNKAAEYYDLAIKENSERAVILKEKLLNGQLNNAKFRMIRGYSFAYYPYALLLKNGDEFNLDDEVQYNFALNSARLGNDFAIIDIYEWFYKNKGKNPFDDSLMCFLLEQGIKHGNRNVILLQMSLCKGQRKYSKRYKKMAELNEKYCKLGEEIISSVKEICKQYREN